MRQGFCVFITREEELDWRAPSQILPSGSRPILIEDQDGVVASLHDYDVETQTFANGKTIRQVCEEARAEMADFA